MALTYVAIATVTVGSGGANSIEFTNIPQTYTDLKLVFSVRSSRPTVNMNETELSINGTTTNYYELQIRGSGTAVASSSRSNTAVAIMDLGQPAATATASTFGNYEVYIPNYTSSNNKSLSIDGVTENNATAAFTYLVAALWANSAAITSIKIEDTDSPTYNYVQYSTATLYGIKNTV